MQKTVLLAFLFLLNLSAQHLSGQSKIYGEVFFREKPLAGVQVTVEGTGQVAETDINGVFILNGMNGIYKLRFIYEKYNKLSKEIDALNGNLIVQILPNNKAGVTINYSQDNARNLSIEEYELKKSSEQLAVMQIKSQKSSSEFLAIKEKRLQKEQELKELETKFKSHQSGITELDIARKKSEMRQTQNDEQEMETQYYKLNKAMKEVQENVDQKQEKVILMRTQYRKMEAEQQLKFEVANSLRAESAFYNSLNYLPIALPVSSQKKYIKSTELWPRNYSRRAIITFDSIAYWINHCITDKTESGLNVSVKYYRCGKGLAVVILPHVVDEQGHFLHNNLQKKFEEPKTWWDILLGWSDTKVAYIRSLVFIFSDESPILSEPPPLDLAEVPADAALASAGFTTDVNTLIKKPARNTNCTVIAYMYKFYKGEPDQIEPFDSVHIDYHLGKDNTNLGSHLMKFYPDTDCYH